MKRSTPPPSPPVLTKLTKHDTEFLDEMKSIKERLEKERKDSLDKLRFVLPAPTKEEMHMILYSIRSILVVDPTSELLCIDINEEDAMSFTNVDKFPWLKTLKQQLNDYNERIEEEALWYDDSRDFVSSCIREQLRLYFQSIADAWNSKYTVIRLITLLNFSSFGFKTIMGPQIII
jgi:hypothetical protein